MSSSSDIIAVLSVSTPNPRRLHLMDKNGFVLCENNHLKFCIADAHRGYKPGIRRCVPCRIESTRMVKEIKESLETIERLDRKMPVEGLRPDLDPYFRYGDWR